MVLHPFPVWGSGRRIYGVQVCKYKGGALDMYRPQDPALHQARLPKPIHNFDYIPPANEYDGVLKGCVGILDGEGMKLAATHYVAACETRCRIARHCPPPKTHGTQQEFMSIFG